MTGLLLMFCGGPAALAQTPSPSPSPGSGGTNAMVAGAADTKADVIVLPRSVPDPFEPFNRVVWAFNRGLLVQVVKPTSKAYRFVVRKPLRVAIANFGRNINYPGRFINQLLQGRWGDARHETDRFFCNTIAGAAGFLDVATLWKIPKAEADFGQTFGVWGWQPTCYIMLPVFGPSNERDTLGWAADASANPLTYITPYSITTENPLTFFSPYVYFSYAIIYNNLADSVDGYARFVTAETDPYALMQFAWTFVRETKKPDLRLTEEPDRTSLETLQSTMITVADPRFSDRGSTRSLRIQQTGRRLNYDLWLRPEAERAPVVYLVPGLGSHRRAELNLALAELVHRSGFTVVCVSSPFNPEFMENASQRSLPGYAPADAQDLHRALTAIDRRLEKKYPQRLGRRALMGYSMGGFETLMVAAMTATNNPPLLHFDRLVAIDTPVRLLHGVAKLDEFYNAPLQWPREERTARIENTFLKVASAGGTAGLKPQASVRLGGIESKFLIGLAFRFILRDTIYSSQRLEDQNILRHSLKLHRRKPVYSEILQFSFQDYFERFVLPYYRERFDANLGADALGRAGDLRTYGDALQADPRLRVMVNENDFLLTPEDLNWLRTTLGPDRVQVFPGGGHLGNLGDPDVQAAIVKMLSGLSADSDERQQR
jgi:ABC-type transporter lipoprotein component MlaA/pimeloyl-ACP methyl ester carboxylesterase